MQIKIESTKDNPLLKRKEVGFTIMQGPKDKTPTRAEVKAAIASEMKIGNDVVFVKRMRTKTGTLIAEGVANVYQTVAQATLVEPGYIRKRNGMAVEKKSKKEAKA